MRRAAENGEAIPPLTTRHGDLLIGALILRGRRRLIIGTLKTHIECAFFEQHLDFRKQLIGESGFFELLLALQAAIRDLRLGRRFD